MVTFESIVICQICAICDTTIPRKHTNTAYKHGRPGLHTPKSTTVNLLPFTWPLITHLFQNHTHFHSQEVCEVNIQLVSDFTMPCGHLLFCSFLILCLFFLTAVFRLCLIYPVWPLPVFFFLNWVCFMFFGSSASSSWTATGSVSTSTSWITSVLESHYLLPTSLSLYTITTTAVYIISLPYTWNSYKHV